MPGGASMPSNKPKVLVKAKVYAITPGEVDLQADKTAEVGVITGKVRLKQFSMCALFDSKASRSFISSNCVRRCELKAELMPQKVLVAIPYEKIIGCTSIVKNCQLEIANLVLTMDLIVFRIMEFNLILGMDWLLRHYAKIDCHS
ncbi:uncharacterized protein LOC122282320 [Carya illinoinensis]|uniref:uncharacterized protein LOC122282320 n=1 Tax=Carya illinoinensis TaxID=32201 RepID=UPI001C71F5B2|nr:uncharacterized protein LOC122282320 [Carya illinoinensis]